jgi:hypothetical protein
VSEYHDAADYFRHGNLVRIGRVLGLPARASAERQAAWRADTAPRAAAQPQQAQVRSFAKRHRLFALATSGLAAAAVLVFWLTVGHAKPVSAATILDGLKLALGRSLSIQLTDIDLGTVQLNGRILLDQERAPVAETGLAEVQVGFKSDNPEWYDLGAELVICETPTQAWQYGCGDEVPPGSMWDRLLGEQTDRRLYPREYLKRNHSWHSFWTHPLDGFGQLPERLHFGYVDSQVSYSFFPQQRTVIEQLLRFLLPLCDGHTAEAVIADLRDSCSRMDVERSDSATYVLHASGFNRLGALDLSDPQVPDVSELAKEYTAEISYDVAKGRVDHTQGFSPPGLRESGVWVSGAFPRDMPQGSPEELVAWLRERAADVQVNDTKPDQWKIRVRGYPFPLDLSGIEWQREFVKQARAALALDVFYDSATHAVQRAVLRGVGWGSGQITLTVGEVKIEPAWLDPEHWTTLQTTVSEP